MILFYLVSILFPLLASAVPAPEGRGPATPFISGDTFRFFADHVYDELDQSLNPETIQPGNTIFVKTDYLSDFFTSIHPNIANPYILISHNSDAPAPGSFSAYLEDPKLLAWFGQNHDGYLHPKMHPIPIGLANAQWEHGDFRQILELKSKKLIKRYLAYLNINVDTFSQERKKVAKFFSKQSYCYKGKPQEYGKFLKEIAASYFVISPRGNGLDTHRLWESLYLGSIPIVKTSSLDALYSGLPVLIVQNWEDVTETFLKQKQKEWGGQKKNLQKLSISYWLNEIAACRGAIQVERVYNGSSSMAPKRD